jgi:glycine/D-amino acid oxidase-like deaminating enzyme
VLTDLTGVSDTVTLQKADGSWSFFIPRFFDGGTVIGGTKQPGDWSSTPDLATRQTLLDNASKIAPYALPASQTVQGARFIADIVGRRPTREGGMRIEVEHAKVGSSGHSRGEQVVHAYGAGGRGFEISWGVAAEVAKLAKDTLTAETPRSVRAKL